MEELHQNHQKFLHNFWQRKKNYKRNVKQKDFNFKIPTGKRGAKQTAKPLRLTEKPTTKKATTKNRPKKVDQKYEETR